MAESSAELFPCNSMIGCLLIVKARMLCLNCSQSKLYSFIKKISKNAESVLNISIDTLHLFESLYGKKFEIIGVIISNPAMNLQVNFMVSGSKSPFFLSECYSSTLINIHFITFSQGRKKD